MLTPKSTFSKQLPYLIAIVGSCFALLLWYGLVVTHPSTSFIKIAFPWMALIIGFSTTLFCAGIIYLTQLIQERALIRSFIADEAAKELTKRLSAEESKQKLEVALLQGQKLQAIGTLAGGVAHDFNNILYAIKGFVEMSREDIKENTLIYSNLGKVLEAVQRAQDLVEGILAFGRRQQQFDFTPLPIQPVIEGILALLKPTIPASVHISLLNLSDNCVILGNQAQLHQVMVNIIINAVDAMEGEGTITIELSRVLADDDCLKQFPKVTHTPYCKIKITDTGHGMDQSTMKRIFEPFYTTKEVGKGTGLGLAIVHSIIEQHKGEMTVSSQLGRGTIFTILLPEHQ